MLTAAERAFLPGAFTRMSELREPKPFKFAHHGDFTSHWHALKYGFLLSSAPF